MRKTIGLALLIALVAGVLLWHVRGSTTAEPAHQASARPAPTALPHSGSPPPRAPALPARADDAPPDPAAPARPYPVKLDELRRRIPDNLYWTLGAPTEDEKVLRQREERASQSNVLYGKVLATEATEQEIRQYYADRQRVSQDYIEFAELALAQYRDQLPPDQISLYELSIKLNRARLDQIPRDQSDALTRLKARTAR